MSDTHDKVMKMVREELAKNPDASNDDLYAKAQKIDRSIGDLSLRQFHARFPLQVKRKKAQSRKTRKASGSQAPASKTAASRKSSKSGRSRSSAKGVHREAVRDALLAFAREVSAAEGKTEMIDLVTGIDQHVDRVIAAVDGSGA